MLYTVSLKFIFIWFLNLRPESELAEQSKTKIQNRDICIKSPHKKLKPIYQKHRKRWWPNTLVYAKDLLNRRRIYKGHVQAYDTI